MGVLVSGDTVGVIEIVTLVTVKVIDSVTAAFSSVEVALVTAEVTDSVTAAFSSAESVHAVWAMLAVIEYVELV